MNTATQEKTLPELCEQFGITLEVAPAMAPKTASLWQKDSNCWEVTLKQDNRKMTFLFYQGRAHTTPPTCADVVHCVASDYNIFQESGNLEGFGGFFGWDENTLPTWRAVKRQSIRWELLIQNKATREAIGACEY